LANWLIASGIQPKDTVAVYAERNASLVIAIFGVLKAGAAFLILDPGYPPARTLEYLRIAQPKGWLQLSRSGEPDELATYLDAIDLPCRRTIPGSKNELLESLSAFPHSTPGVRVSADDPAYIAFTSGSTGEPKGVICRQGPITHFLPWQKEAFGLNENDRFAMVSGLAYSHLHRDIFTAIDLGATIYIPNPSEARSPDQLINWLDRNAITVLHLTPALGQLLLTGAKPQLPSVRRVFFGGDVLTRDNVAQIRELTPNAIIGSFYGATETQRAVGYCEITDEPNEMSSRTVPLGKGIRDVQLLVLSGSGQLAGVGELGEIFVRSPHLATGYIGDEERTQRMFLKNPFTRDPSDRLYRTGELGRYLPDGNIEWAGRNDRRVNIRGFRVELEEIETVLRQHPVVREAAVVLGQFNESESDNPKPVLSQAEGSNIQNPKSVGCVVAYIVSTEENSQSLSDLLYSYVSTRLPDYMVPVDFVVLDQLPLSPNGKVDYRALPAPQQFRSAESTLIQPPRNELEGKLCAIFCQVLHREQVGTNENFFRLGGHSLLAAQVAARIQEEFRIGLELRTFLESPTVAALAKYLEIRLEPTDTTTVSDDTSREEIEL
jgi:amino acid adenylation domain-containing protein